MPVMGSDWMAQKGLTAQPQNHAAGLLGEAMGGVAPMLAAAKAKNIIEGLLSLGNRGNQATNTVANGLQSGADLGKIDTLASKFVGHEPKPQPQRNFNVDYPQATGGSPGSRLAFDIDGNPLSATSLIAGRRVVGGADEGVSRVGQDWIASQSGVPILRVNQSGLGTDVGRIATTTDRRSGDLLGREIQISNALKGDEVGRTVGHEVAHLVDQIATGIPTKGIEKPLSQMFSELNTQGYVSKWQKGATPELFNYKGADIGREKMAEAIYGYLRDPNWMKTKFPDVAKRIRDYVNTNPNLKDVIQFNSAGARHWRPPACTAATVMHRNCPRN